MTNGEVKRNMNYCQDEFSFDPRKHVLGVYLDAISKNCTDIFEARGAIREKKSSHKTIKFYCTTTSVENERRQPSF